MNADQSLVGLVALPARHARVASFGVRQPCCRTSRARDMARVRPLTMLVTEIRCVLVTIMASAGNEITFYCRPGSHL